MQVLVQKPQVPPTNPPPGEPESHSSGGSTMPLPQIGPTVVVVVLAALVLVVLEVVVVLAAVVLVVLGAVVVVVVAVVLVVVVVVVVVQVGLPKAMCQSAANS